jgi:uncharacterized protein YbjT (DUF2867 family)
MRIAVVGGTGVLGSLVVGELVARGDEVRILSRRAPARMPQGASHRRIDLADGEGLSEGIEGMEAVVDASNELKKAEAVLVEGTRRLLEAESAAGVDHHVAISIVGCDRTPWSYYDAKVAQEQAVSAGPVPWSTLRATQFHQLLSGTFGSAGRYRLAPVSRRVRLQPIDPAVVAKRLAEIAHAEPAGRVPDVAGPRVQTLSELSRAWRRHAGRRLLPIPAPIPGKLGRSLREGSLCNPEAAAGGPTLAEWLGGGPGPTRGEVA